MSITAPEPAPDHAAAPAAPLFFAVRMTTAVTVTVVLPADHARHAEKLAEGPYALPYLLAAAEPAPGCPPGTEVAVDNRSWEVLDVTPTDPPPSDPDDAAADAETSPADPAGDPAGDGPAPPEGCPPWSPGIAHLIRCARHAGFTVHPHRRGSGVITLDLDTHGKPWSWFGQVSVLERSQLVLCGYLRGGVHGHATQYGPGREMLTALRELTPAVTAGRPS